MHTRPKFSKGQASQIITHTCGACFSAKVKCDGELPCSRCFRSCLPCRPRARGGAEVSLSIVFEMIAQRTDPRPLAEFYIQTFLEYHHKGLIDREKAVVALRAWRKASTCVESDITWGAASMIAKTLSISPVELETQEELGLEAPSEIRRRQALEAMRRLKIGCHRLKLSEAFRRVDDGATPMRIFCLEEGQICSATNDAYERLFKSGEEILDQTVRRKSLMCYLSSSVVAHEDRHLWFCTHVEALFTQTGGTFTHFFKLFDLQGEVRLFILSSRRININGKVAFCCRVEPVPCSRYISDRPEPHVVVKSFRSVNPMEGNVLPQGVAVAGGGLGSVSTSVSPAAEGAEAKGGQAACQHDLLDLPKKHEEIQRTKEGGGAGAGEGGEGAAAAEGVGHNQSMQAAIDETTSEDISKRSNNTRSNSSGISKSSSNIISRSSGSSSSTSLPGTACLPVPPLGEDEIQHLLTTASSRSSIFAPPPSSSSTLAMTHAKVEDSIASSPASSASAAASGPLKREPSSASTAFKGPPPPTPFSSSSTSSSTSSCSSSSASSSSSSSIHSKKTASATDGASISFKPSSSSAIPSASSSFLLASSMPPSSSSLMMAIGGGGEDRKYVLPPYHDSQSYLQQQQQQQQQYEQKIPPSSMPLHALSQQYLWSPLSSPRPSSYHQQQPSSTAAIYPTYLPSSSSSTSLPTTSTNPPPASSSSSSSDGGGETSAKKKMRMQESVLPLLPTQPFKREMAGQHEALPPLTSSSFSSLHPHLFHERQQQQPHHQQQHYHHLHEHQHHHHHHNYPPPPFPSFHSNQPHHHQQQHEQQRQRSQPYQQQHEQQREEYQQPQGEQEQEQQEQPLSKPTENEALLLLGLRKGDG